VLHRSTKLQERKGFRLALLTARGRKAEKGAAIHMRLINSFVPKTRVANTQKLHSH